MQRSSCERLYRSVCLISCLFFLSQTGLSQKSSDCIIQGRILSEEKEAIPYSQVLNISRTDSTLVNYSIADAEGHYQIKASCNDDILLKVRSLNFKEEYLFFTLKRDTIINFFMEEDLYVLDEIHVKGHRPVVEKGDTTTFNVSYFSNDTEENVEDLIKKLPGFEVSTNGEIRYPGKPIDKILLDGDDLVGEDYKILSKNLSADLISKIDVVKNYTDEKMFRGIARTGDIAVNLQIKDNRKSAFFGTASSKTDFLNNYSIFSNLLSYTDKTKLVFLGQANTLGENPDEYENNSITNEDLYPFAPFSLPLSASQNQKMVNDEYYNINESQYGSLSLIRDIGSFEVKNQLGISNIQNLISDQFTTDYFNQNNSIVRSKDEKLESRLLRNTFKGLYSKQNFEIEFTASNLFDKVILNSSEIINQDELDTKLDEKHIESIYSIKYANKITTKSALLSKFYYRSQERDQDYFNSTDLLFENSASTNGLQQGFLSKREQFHLTNKFVKKYKNFNLSMEFRADYVDGIAKKEVILSDSSFFENIEIDHSGIDLIPTVKYQFGKSLLGISPSVTYINLSLADVNNKLLLPNLSVFLNTKISRKSKINFVLAKNTSIIDLMQLSKTVTIKDANILNMNGLNEVAVSKGYSMILSYFNRGDLLSSYYLSFIWSQEYQATQTNYFIGEGQILLSPRLGSGGSIISLSGGLDKYIDYINGTLKFNSSLTKTYTPFFINDILSPSSNYSISNKISFVNVSGKVLHFDASFSDNRSWSDLASSDDFALFQKLSLGMQIIPKKGVLIGISNQWFFIKNTSTSTFLNFRSSWKVSEKLSLGLEAINILNNQTFLIREIYNQFEVQEVTFLRNPLILFKAGVDF